mgnify:CR=1 FL=1
MTIDTELPIRYVVVTPVRDEEKYIEHTINSMISQTCLPVEWIIVNDGSKDRTGEIIEKYARQFEWIHIVQREDRGYRKAGGGVVEAFYEGYNIIRENDWDYIVKLDGDLRFENKYFEECFKEFISNPKLGIGGGTIYNNIGGEYVREDCPGFHVRGATKIYRKECWVDIGDLIRAPGWDTLDEIKANMLGWETHSFLKILLYQERPTGGANGQWGNFVKNGLANYISGYHPFFMLLKCIKRFSQKPMIIGSVGLMYGYLSGYLKNIKQVEDKEILKYIRRQQINRLTFRDSIWRY